MADAGGKGASLIFRGAMRAACTPPHATLAQGERRPPHPCAACLDPMRASAAFKTVDVGARFRPQIKRRDAARGQRFHRLPQQDIMRMMAAARIGGVADVIGGPIAVGEK